jgi:hypothetical protein
MAPKLDCSTYDFLTSQWCESDTYLVKTHTKLSILIFSHAGDTCMILSFYAGQRQ